MMKKEKVMVIGASIGQLPLIELCQRYGYYVIAVSPRGNYIGLSVADEVLYEDVRNKETILDFAKINNIVGVVSDQLDMAVPTVAYIAQNLGIVGNTIETANKFTNKAAMRMAAEKAGVKIPNFFEASTMQEAESILQCNASMRFPLMIKPVDSAASRGVHRVDSFTELSIYFEEAKKWSKTGSVIIERYIEGQEYVVEAYTHNYTPTTLAVGIREYFNLPDTFIPCSTIFVDANSADSQSEEKVKIENEKLIRSFGLKYGITHGEFICEKETGDIYLVEIAARGGGVQTSSAVVPACCGVNVVDLLVRDTLSLYDETKEIVLEKGAAGYFCFILPEGLIETVEGCDEVKNTPGVIEAYFSNFQIGENIRSIRDKSARKGPIVVYGPTRAACLEIRDKIKGMLKINVNNTQSVDGIIWK